MLLLLAGGGPSSVEDPPSSSETKLSRAPPTPWRRLWSLPTDEAKLTTLDLVELLASVVLLLLPVLKRLERLLDKMKDGRMVPLWALYPFRGDGNPLTVSVLISARVLAM